MDKIIEGNKLIAEFMGHPCKMWIDPDVVMGSDYNCIEVVPDVEDRELFTVSYNFGLSEAEAWDDELEDAIPPYSLSWDWLMLVVEKIESLPLHEEIQEVKDTVWGDCYATVDMKSDRCLIWLMPNWTIVNVFCGKGRLCATYNAIIEFIKWYNKQKENESK